MTREEAQNGLQWTATNEIMLENRAIKLIDRIYDDFQSRTCENCSHNNSCEMQYVLRQGVTNPSFLKDFGCNKFVRKDT